MSVQATSGISATSTAASAASPQSTRKTLPEDPHFILQKTVEAINRQGEQYRHLGTPGSAPSAQKDVTSGGTPHQRERPASPAAPQTMENEGSSAARPRPRAGANRRVSAVDKLIRDAARKH